MLPLLVLSAGVEDILRSSYTKHFTYIPAPKWQLFMWPCRVALWGHQLQTMFWSCREELAQLASEVCCEGKEKETISSFSVGTTETRLEEAVVCTSSKEEGVLEEPDANATSIVCSASGKLEVSLQLWTGRGLVSKIPLLFSFILQKYLQGCKCRTLCY